MTSERDLEPTAERGAMDRGHDRLRRVLEFGDVGAGNEGAPAAGKYDALHFRICDCGLHALQDATANRGAQCVDGGTVDGDDADDVVTFELDHFVHATLLGCLFLDVCSWMLLVECW